MGVAVPHGGHAQMKTLLTLVFLLLAGCATPTKYYADIQVYDDVKWGILPQIDGAKCKHIGFVLTDTPHMRDFEMKLRCSLREVP